MPVKIMEGVSSASAGNRFCYVVLNDGRLYSIGDNGLGQCGNGKSTGLVKKPYLVMECVKEAKAGHVHGIALQTNGDVWIWGCEYGIAKGEN